MGKHASQQSDHKFWRVHIEAWSKSGLTQAEYCRQRQLSQSAFTYWKKRLSPDQMATSCLVPLPFRLPITDRAKLSVPFGLVVGDRFRLEIAADFDPALLEKILLTLGRLS